MYAATLKLLQMSLRGAVLILAAAFIRSCLLRILPKGALRLLWIPAILALLLPLPVLYTVTLPMPVHPVEGTSLSETEADRVDWDSWEALPASEPGGILTTEAGTAVEQGRGTPLLPLVWLAGAGLLGCGVLLLYLREYARLRRAVPLRGSEAWLREHPAYRKLSLRLLPGLPGPMTYGVFRPAILLPEEPDWERLPDLLALEHEYVHVRHLDVAWKLLMHLLLILHWFSPAVWLMYFLLNRDLELGCDEAVLRRFGRERRTDFACLLVDSGRRGRFAAFPGLKAGMLRERVNAIMRYRRAGMPRRCLAGALVLGLTLGAFCSLRAGAAGETLYRSGGMLLSVPDELKDLLIVETPALTGETEEVLFRVLERETWEAGMDLYPDSRREYGLILTILRTDEATAGRYLRQVTAWDLLARDEQGYYYMVKHSTVEANMLTSPDTEDQDARWERRKLVNAWVRDLRNRVEWQGDTRTRYPAYSSAVSAYLSSVLTNRTHRYHISWGEAGTRTVTGSTPGDPFLERMIWETASESARVSAAPPGEPIIVTQPFRDRDLYFWPGSDVVLCKTNASTSSDARSWYIVRLLDEPEIKVGDLAAAWFRAVDTD